MRKIIMSLLLIAAFSVPAYAQHGRMAYAPPPEEPVQYGYVQQGGYGHPEYVPQTRDTTRDGCVTGRCNSKGPKGTYTTPPRRTARGYVTQSGKESFLHDDLTGIVYEPDGTRAGVARLEYQHNRSVTKWTGCPDDRPNRNAKNIQREEWRDWGYDDQVYGDHPAPSAVVMGGSSEGMIKGFVKAIPNALVGAFSGGTDIAVEGAKVIGSGNSKSISKSRSDSKSISKSRSGANVDVGVKVK